MPVALQTIKEIVRRSEDLQTRLRERLWSPHQEKTLTRRYSVTEASKMVGRTAQAIRDAEDRGDLPPPELNPDNNRRLGYLLESVNYMRQVFGTLPSRRPDNKPVVLGIQNFKGGVGKSTIATHGAQYFARQGYRTLLIDCDSQASATSTFGFHPDKDISEDETLLPFFEGSKRTLRYAVRDTYWDRLKLVPAALSLYAAEYHLAARGRATGAAMFRVLRDGIADVSDDFDVVIIDPPPALGMISLNVLAASTALLVPMQPGMYDFASTMQFFRMLSEVLPSVGPELEYDFVRILISMKGERVSDPNRASTQDDITDLAQAIYGEFVLDNVIYKSRAIEAAAGEMRTIYELEQAVGSARTFRRTIDEMDAAFGEVEELIRTTWDAPSSARRTRKSA